MYPLLKRAAMRRVPLNLFILSCLIGLLSGAAAQQTAELTFQVAPPGAQVQVNGVNTLVIPKQGANKIIVSKSTGFSGLEARRLHVKVNNLDSNNPVVKLLKPDSITPQKPDGEFVSEITGFSPGKTEISAIGNIQSNVEIIADVITDSGQSLQASAQIRVLPLPLPSSLKLLDGANVPLKPADSGDFTLSLPQGITVKRRVALYQANSTNSIQGLVTWESSVPDAVQFSFNGGPKTGKLTVMAGDDVDIIALKTTASPVSVSVSSVLPVNVESSVKQTLTVTVMQPVTDFTLDSSTLKMRENDSKTVAAKIGETPQMVTWSLENVEPAKSVKLDGVLTATSIKVQGIAAGTATLVAEYKAENANTIRRTLPVTVQPTVKSVAFKTSATELFIGRTVEVTLEFSNPGKKVIEEADLLPFNVRSSDESILSVTQDNQLTPRVITVTALKVGQGSLIVETLDEQGKATRVGSRSFDVVTVGAFKKIKVGLQPMDDRTVGDSFGGRLAGEYYVFIVTITNKVGAKDGTGSGTQLKPIIISSASIGLHIQLEKQYNSKAGSKNVQRGSRSQSSNLPLPRPELQLTDSPPLPGWTPLTVSEYRHAFMPEDGSPPPESGTSTGISAFIPFGNGQTSSQAIIFPQEATIYEAETVKLYFRSRATGNITTPGTPGSVPGTTHNGTAQGMAEKPEDEEVLWSVDNSTYAYIIRDGVLHGLSESRDGVIVTAINKAGLMAQARIKILKNNRPYQFVYYPYSSDLILDVVDVRNSRTLHTGPFNLARALGTGVSFFTAANILRGQTATSVLDKYSNLLLPGLERLFPTERDSQRRNLEQRLMKSVERLAAGESIQKLILFPKRPFGGILRGYLTRIGEIQTNYLEVEVGVIESTTPEAGTPSGSNNAGSN